MFNRRKKREKARAAEEQMRKKIAETCAMLNRDIKRRCTSMCILAPIMIVFSITLFHMFLLSYVEYIDGDGSLVFILIVMLLILYAAAPLAIAILLFVDYQNSLIAKRRFEAKQNTNDMMHLTINAM